jgi:hypothetical protein
MNRTVRIWQLWALIGLALDLVIVGCNVSPKSFPPTPRPGTGVVIGQLVSSSKTDFPYTAQDLYLGRLIPATQSDAEPAVAFTYGDDPGTTVRNPDGTFAFTDVVPGTYALLIWTSGSSFAIQAPGGGLTKVVVEADKTTDLGTVVLR